MHAENRSVTIEDIDDPRDDPSYTNVLPSDGSLLEGPIDYEHARTYDEFFSFFHKNADGGQAATGECWFIFRPFSLPLNQNI